MSITFIIIAITVAVTVYTWNQPELQYKLMLNPYSISKKNEYFRFITSGFIHQDFIHLGFNMFTFYFFGQAIEYIYSNFFGELGPFLFVALYLVGIVVSDLPTYLKHKENPGYNSLGASGGVSAVVFSSILFYPLNEICFYGLLCFPGFILGALYIIYSIYMGKKSMNNINHDAHLYGALFGIAFSILIRPAVFVTFLEQVATYRPFS
ncbi:rhomboid family intramembrane serine protease [soil metagenome]